MPRKNFVAISTCRGRTHFKASPCFHFCASPIFCSCFFLPIFHTAVANFVLSQNCVECFFLFARWERNKLLKSCTLRQKEKRGRDSLKQCAVHCGAQNVNTSMGLVEAPAATITLHKKVFITEPRHC